MGKIINKMKIFLHVEKIFIPFALMTMNPTNPYRMPLPYTAPDGLALVCTAGNPSEAELIREILLDEGFHVEYVAAMTTGLFGTTGNPHVYVHTEEAESAQEFLRQLFEDDPETK